ncbi:MAG: hypothetical protein P8Y61_14720 [Gammaproteobacteria bacterium]
MQKQSPDGYSGSPIEFESFFEQVPNQAQDGSLQVNVALTATFAVGAFQAALAVLALRHQTVIPGSIRRVNSARVSNQCLDVTGW